MRFTLFGYPKTGKTTLFNLLTDARIEVKAFDDLNKQPNLRQAHVPDERLDAVSALFPDKEKKQADIDFVDLAGTAFGEIKNSSYLNHLRTADGLVHVARGFAHEQVPHPKGSVDARRDIAAMEDELLFADLVSVEARLDKLDKDLARNPDPEGVKERDVLKLLHDHLGQGQALRTAELSPALDKIIRPFAFLSRKPILHVINVGEADIPAIPTPGKLAAAPGPGAALLAFCGTVESEIMELEDEEKSTFLAEYGLTELSAARFLKTAYSLLRVITFYTLGEKEVKAWTIREGQTAVQAAGAVHTDIAKGFIKAEVSPVESLLEAGSIPAARDRGTVRLEGRDYAVRDGDVIYFRFSK
ncbi:MAG: DUF933 domain-containing protein [Acidobacteria bacterium]|nr:DUF933 domain-containing protein [Acidobacteriota bacterium]